ncbi:TonB-dependent receptor plug domain-containing protein [Alteromonas facilis]|uniref:TonB-dependent receptor plug domain-containing protein n=1 Tax=Alteromonas facilis TaxID=2048004 RepID=UPI000C287020|nr:TonB-dependent receptor [Alteromonas facilis]
MFLSTPNWRVTPVTLAISVCLSGPVLATELQTPDASEQVMIERITVHGQVATKDDTINRTLVSGIAPDVREQIDTEPGYSINSNGVVTGIVQHRGMFGDRIHVSHQGASVFGAGPNAMDSPLSHVIVAQHPKVTFYRGIAPVSAGYESIGGAIKFEQQDWQLSHNNSLQYSGNLAADYTDNGGREQYSTFNEWVDSSWGLRVAAQYQVGENYQDAKGDDVNHTLYERLLGSVSGIWASDVHELTYDVGYNKTNVAGTPALAMDIEFITALWYRTQYQYQANDATFRVRLFGNNNRHDMSNFVLRNAMPAMQRRNGVSSDVLGFAAEYEREWRVDSSAIYWVSGVEAVERDHESDIINPANEMFFIRNFNGVERDLLTAFSELNWRDDSGVFATFGLRPTRVSFDAMDVGTSMAMMNPNAAALAMAFNRADKSQTRTWVDVSLQAGLALDDDWTLFATVAEKGRAPGYHALFTWFPLGISAGLADGRNYLGNLDLQEEKAREYELALTYQTKQASVKPRVFYYDVADYILGRPSDNPSANAIAMMMGAAMPLQWQNIEAELYGFDVSASVNITQHWSLQAAYEWVRGNDVALDQPLYRIAPQRLDVSTHYAEGDWQAYAALTLVSRQDEVSLIQNEQITPGYAVVNLGGAKVLAEGLTLNVAINNLLDKQYATHLGGVNRVMSDTLAIGERIPEMGRSVNVSVRYLW